MPWERPLVEVVSVERHAADTLISLRLPDGISPPLFPASLLAEGDEWRQLVHLDGVVRIDADIHVFRTEEIPAEDLAGRTLGYQQWWSPDALALVADNTLRWERVVAPSPEEHEHCRLDMTTIETGFGDGTAWRSNTEWVCAECYQRYFVEDHLGIRHA